MMEKSTIEIEVENALKVLKAGGTILYPTDTIWGIGCDATNARAVENIYKIKQRAESKSLIILVDSFEKIGQYVAKVPDITFDLVSGVEEPLTIVFANAKNLAKNVIAPDKSIAIRIVKNTFCQKLIQQFEKPIVSSSANISGEATPLYFNKIDKEIIRQVDYVVKVGQDNLKEVKPSKIIRINEDGSYEIIRN
ncbi:MAG TPA: L-threonylcarbamoyladenylate synthase [Bacteroidales bacterium]|nr:L-threonylcarbamoyladenylate synthase [Bacteroidales bacterium]